MNLEENDMETAIIPVGIELKNDGKIKVLKEYEDNVYQYFAHYIKIPMQNDLDEGENEDDYLHEKKGFQLYLDKDKYINEGIMEYEVKLFDIDQDALQKTECNLL